MKILVAGASGFIGSELVNHLAKNNQLTVLGRSLDKLKRSFSASIDKLSWDQLKTHDAKDYNLIINLSGSSIGERRWTNEVKKELIESRTLSNQNLIEWLNLYNAKPRFFCANAVGIYGAKTVSVNPVDETTLLPNTAEDFLQEIGLQWEHSLKDAVDAGTPLTIMRFGVVLKKGQGMLKKLELPFSLGLGVTLGSGEQISSWVHYKDLIAAIDFLIMHSELTGPINITAPSPIAQKYFAKQLATVLKRPLLLKMPDLMVKLIFGEMGEYLLLKGQKVLPKRLLDAGFKFTYPELITALQDLYQ